jgi:hypothetical protein
MLEEFLPPPELMHDVGIGHSDAALASVALAFIMTFVVALFTGDAETEIASTKTNTFGWLQADLRMPLPPWEELKEACHLVGKHDGHYMFLCADASQDDGLTKCEVSSDFSLHYGRQVYVCIGGKAEERRESGSVHTGL